MASPSKCGWAPTQSQTWVTPLTAFLGALQLLSILQVEKLRPPQAKGVLSSAQLGTGAGTTLGGLTLKLGPVTQPWVRNQRKGPVFPTGLKEGQESCQRLPVHRQGGLSERGLALLNHLALPPTLPEPFLPLAARWPGHYTQA